MSTMSTTRFADRRWWIVLALLLTLLGLHLTRAGKVEASGHSWYSYKAGKNCKGTNNIVDPVGIIFITHSTVGKIGTLIDTESAALHAQNGSIKYWSHGNVLDDLKGQQSAYYRGSTRVCSSFNDQNATSGAVRSRYHVRLHTGGPSSSNVGYNIVAGTPHYDKLCGLPLHPKHEIWTFAGARTQLAKVFPKSKYPGQYIKYVGNTHSRHFSCLNKDTAGDGYVLFVFAENG
jgi:hypothetical protein